MIAALGRAALLYIILLASIRIMGKREIGALSPSDLVVAILIAELASVPIDNPDMPLWHGIAPILRDRGDANFVLIWEHAKFALAAVPGRNPCGGNKER